eukprot:350066-Chlamydomonas_euryale.AAC.8
MSARRLLAVTGKAGRCESRVRDWRRFEAFCRRCIFGGVSGQAPDSIGSGSDSRRSSGIGSASGGGSSGSSSSRSGMRIGSGSSICGGCARSSHAMTRASARVHAEC